MHARRSTGGGRRAAAPRVAPSRAHHVAVSAEGYQDDTRDVTLVPGVTTAVELNLREQPGLLTVQAEGGATVYVDGRAVLESLSRDTRFKRRAARTPSRWPRTAASSFARR